MDLFDIEGVLPGLSVLVERAKSSIANLIRAGHPIVVAWSSGKDSSTVLCLAIETALELLGQGLQPMIVVTTSDTLVESPEIRIHIYAEAKKLVKYGRDRGLDISFYVSKPSLMSTFQLKILTGRGLPSYAGGNADCSVNYKVNPQHTLRNRLFAKWRKANLPEPVTLLGTRISESERRALRMKGRGDNAINPVRNKDGDLVLSPICNFTTEDVWEFIGEAASSMRPSYTDFKDTMRIYSDAGGTSCAVVSDAILDGLSKKRTGKCGARTGCFVCQQAYDKSLRTMVETDERYAYAKGLVRYNEYLRAIRWDWSRRNWVGRTIKGGYLCIQPDAFSPQEARRQTRYLMQLDYDERQRAKRAGERPKFEILPLEMLIAIDAWWSLAGYAAPFTIWAYRRAIEHGVRFDIPENVPVVDETPVPDARFLYVGDEWRRSVWDGLRDPFRESLLEEGPCALKVAEDGLWELETAATFQVDEEGADLLDQFEVPYLLEQYDANRYQPGGITAGFKHYLGLGTITVSHGQRRIIDEVLCRTALKDRLGLTANCNHDELMAKTVSYQDMRKAGRESWVHKATTASAQTAFDF